MSKKSRSKDNSKRPQPLAQQRAQAHQSTVGTPVAVKEKQSSNGNGRDKKERSERQR